MPVRVLFLGPLSDAFGAGETEMAAPLTWATLMEQLPMEVTAALGDDRVHVAHEAKVLTDKTSLLAEDGDEVALLPPVSGG